VKAFRAADYDTDHYLVVEKVTESLAVNKKRHRFYMERFNLKKLNEAEAREKYRIEVSIVFATLDNLDAEVSQLCLQLWIIWTLRWMLIVLGKRLERISKFQPKRV
jgi:hypothetical protein